ncbi:V-type ATP synthase subunit I [Haloarculaceae archaeon H-GB1-1]|nr:V-type ATP synthase subunit I [Haloarculaceae archaeon H-GB1-1]
MLRPERMSRVSVTGSKRVMDEVIETVHDLNLLHVTEYDGSWDGFDPGNPGEGADDASEKLVTVRSLQSILDVDEENAGPTRLVTDEALETELEDVRQEVNELDDRRNDLSDELRAVEERIEDMEPFVALGIDLDLLGGYESLSVQVGEGNPDSVRAALDDAGVDTYQLFVEGDVIGVFARTDEGTLQDALVNATFSALEIPDVANDDLVDHEPSGGVDPEEYLAELRHRKQQLESKLTTVEDELNDLSLDVAGFLLAAEEKLAIDVQKREAPLTFATTENAFVAEGWIPTTRVSEFEGTLESAVGDSVEVDELERAAYDEDGHAHETEHVEGSGEAPGKPTAADGGLVSMGESEPPVVQDNPGPVRPFESLVQVINKPKYSELDPTVVLFLTFPVFFGFMIGDLGYGVLYLGIGYWIVQSFESDVVKSLGGVALWAGGFTALFGILYGEIFGLHVLGDVLWNGNPPIHKGLQPHYGKYAEAWLLVSAFVGVFHLVLGRLFDFKNNLSHGFGEAMLESGSWIMLTVGLWIWVLSTSVSGPKPDFMYTVFSSGDQAAIPLGFTGFSPTVGMAGLAVAAVGIVMLMKAEGVGIALIESITQGFGHVVSYTRIAAVLLAKAGMAFVVNLLFFGVYVTGHGEDATWHFGLGHMPHVGDMVHGHEVTSIMFGGLSHSGIAGIVGGLLILVLGHLLVLALGITSAGLQAVRLEYVEFFGKFYEGGGKSYTPFGYDRTYTTDN